MNRRYKRGNPLFQVLIGVIFFGGYILLKTGKIDVSNLNFSVIVPYITGIIIFIGIISIFFSARKRSSNDYDDDRREEYKRNLNDKGTNISDFQEEQQEIRCQKCNKVVSKYDISCPHCGARITKMVKCDKCGHMNPETNIICENCNEILY